MREREKKMIGGVRVECKNVSETKAHVNKNRQRIYRDTSEQTLTTIWFNTTTPTTRLTRTVVGIEATNELRRA